MGAESPNKSLGYPSPTPPYSSWEILPSPAAPAECRDCLGTSQGFLSLVGTLFEKMVSKQAMEGSQSSVEVPGLKDVVG